MMPVTGFRGRTQSKVRVGRSRLVSCPLHNADLPMTDPRYFLQLICLIPSIGTRHSYSMLPPPTNHASHVTLSESNKDLTPKPNTTAHSLGCSHQERGFLV